ncbi:M48 family metallopeptidase [candidate division WOR-3 bacterium]|nr:M48 family metallopeptidase [candidate division WOR-3 bacterium]
MARKSKKTENREQDFLKFVTKYRDIRFPRLEFKTGELEAILPNGYNDPGRFIQKHREWIQGKQKFIIDCLKAAKKLAAVRRSRDEFVTLVGSIITHFTQELSVKVNSIYYRKMRTKWASFSARGNVTINTLMRNLPNKQIEYIIYHELTHVTERHHNDRFWKLVSRRFADYERIEASLFSYWFLLNK